MNKKEVTHDKVVQMMEKRWPGFKSKVKKEADKLHIAYKIAEMRKKAHLSQEALAKKIGTTQSVVARMESLKYSDYRVSTLKRIAEATGGTFVINAAA